jgi:hypothetical protein
MNGGEIYGNFASSDGGGVSVSIGRFTMNSGKISGNTLNSTDGGGGGVGVNSGVFIMNDGEISGNTLERGYMGGGGVCVNGYSGSATFTMNGGKIWGNTAISYTGGGVSLYSNSNSFFNKTGGTIYGYDPNDPYSNKVRDSSGAILTDRGHAVYHDATYHKETVVGPNDNLTYNYPNSGNYSGW